MHESEERLAPLPSQPVSVIVSTASSESQCTVEEQTGDCQKPQEQASPAESADEANILAPENGEHHQYLHKKIRVVRNTDLPDRPASEPDLPIETQNLPSVSAMSEADQQQNSSTDDQDDPSATVATDNIASDQLKGTLLMTSSETDHVSAAINSMTSAADTTSISEKVDTRGGLHSEKPLRESCLPASQVSEVGEDELQNTKSVSSLSQLSTEEEDPKVESQDDSQDPPSSVTDDGGTEAATDGADDVSREDSSSSKGDPNKVKPETPSKADKEKKKRPKSLRRKDGSGSGKFMTRFCFSNSTLYCTDSPPQLVNIW